MFSLFSPHDLNSPNTTHDICSALLSLSHTHTHTHTHTRTQQHVNLTVIFITFHLLCTNEYETRRLIKGIFRYARLHARGQSFHSASAVLLRMNRAPHRKAAVVHRLPCRRTLSTCTTWPHYQRRTTCASPLQPPFWPNITLTSTRRFVMA